MKRYFWLAYLLLITLASFLAASIVKASISARLAAPLRSAKAQTQVTSGPLAQASPLAQYAVINTRNIFNANPPAETALQPVAPLPLPLTPEVPETPLQVKLMGTVAGSGPQRFAIIETTADGAAQAVYQVGDIVQQVVIVDISPHCVVFDRGAGRREEVCFQQEGGVLGTAPQSAALAPAVPPPVAPPTRPADAEGIIQVDPGTWRLSRELILENFANVGSLSTQARVTPYFVQGQQQGFLLSRLKGDSVLQQIGLQEGDVLRQVNGLNIHTPQEALQAYQQLQTESTVRINILRNNRPTTLTYELR